MMSFFDFVWGQYFGSKKYKNKLTTILGVDHSLDELSLLIKERNKKAIVPSYS
jgi:hypothetical protein